MTPTPPRIVGAYASEPAAVEHRRSFVEQVLALPGVDGLEIPYGSVKYGEDKPWLWSTLPAGSPVVFTLVAATMEALASDPAWGPASTNPAGREAFLGLLAETRDEVALAVEAGHPVVAVEVQSAPRGTALPPPSASALADSLALAAAWDWSGALLAIEHCDAYRPGAPFAKGFLSLADEIEVARQLADAPTRVALAVNWGRSAIDCRAAGGVDAQIADARAAGVLAGLILSGACATEGAFGAAWADAHAPLAGDRPGGEPASLLTPERVRGALATAGSDLAYDGLKVGIRPADADGATRLQTVRALLEAMG